MEATENSAKVSCSESEVSSVCVINSFKIASSNLVNRILKCFKFEDFKDKYYPQIYKNDPKFLNNVYDQFLVQLKETFINDLDELATDQKIFSKLQELENLVKEATLPEDVKAWRPSGVPHEDVRDHRCQYKLVHKKLLESLLEKMCSGNEQLHEEVMAKHEEIMKLKAKVSQLEEQNQAYFSALEDVDLNMIEDITMDDG